MMMEWLVMGVPSGTRGARAFPDPSPAGAVQVLVIVVVVVPAVMAVVVMAMVMLMLALPFVPGASIGDDAAHGQVEHGDGWQ